MTNDMPHRPEVMLAVPLPLPLSLARADLASFARLGIPPELLSKAHVERVTDEEARQTYAILGPVARDMSGIIFPYFCPATGKRVTARVRRDNPEVEDGREKNKYISAYGDRRHFFFPPNSATEVLDADAPLVLVEAEKSSLALTAWAMRTGRKVVAIGMGGCWGWRGRIGKLENPRGERVDETGPISDLNFVNGRKVYLLLDANVVSNPKVRQAQTALVAELGKRNCEILVCNLPKVDGVNGPDDYIAIRGDAAMERIFTSAGATTDNWPEPEHLGGELPAVQAFTPALLPDALRGLVEDTAERMQVPLDYPAVVSVLCLAGAVNRRANVQPKALDTSWRSYRTFGAPSLHRPG